ncbi:hypothetical protein Tco_1075014 [Tanacetum coccineum]
MTNSYTVGIKNFIWLFGITAAFIKGSAAQEESSGILSKQKTVNGKVQLQALVDKKKVIITESIIRRELQLEDAEGNECLPTATIFEELTRMGRKQKKNTKVSQPSGSTDDVPNENVPTTSNDPLISGEDRLKLTELMDLCTNLQKKVLALKKADCSR